jgi:OmpA-OmpF porin, OOP family
MKLLLKILCTFCPLVTFGQNLILNPSLEEHYECPYGGVYTFWMSKYWHSPSSPPGQPFVDPWTTLGNPATPDYFNVCAASEYTIPSSDFGFQHPKDGNAFGGGYFIADASNGLKEYMTATIVNPLIVGKKYCFSFYTSLADYTSYAIDNIGAYFTVDSAYITTPYLIVQPQVVSPDSVFMSDTTDNWMKVEGEFIAQGGEKYVTIGNFNSNFSTDYIRIQDTVTNIPVFCYYYIDMLELYECKETGIEENTANNIINIYPNPTTGQVAFNYELKDGQQAVFEVFGIDGKLLHSQNVSNQNSQINITLPAISNGIYMARFTVDNKPIFNEKLVIIK